ncbi:MAG: hypothetical protein RQ753_09635, partial [Desulfurivibrionaceae bacterium]|nr:hypothetical protein [Desulfurivibrionaceae bacterium]
MIIKIVDFLRKRLAKTANRKKPAARPAPVATKPSAGPASPGLKKTGRRSRKKPAGGQTAVIGAAPKQEKWNPADFT